MSGDIPAMFMCGDGETPRFLPSGPTSDMVLILETLTEKGFSDDAASLAAQGLARETRAWMSARGMAGRTARISVRAATDGSPWCDVLLSGFMTESAEALARRHCDRLAALLPGDGALLRKLGDMMDGLPVTPGSENERMVDDRTAGRELSAAWRAFKESEEISSVCSKGVKKEGKGGWL